VAQSYVSVPSIPLVTDPATIALLGAGGLNALTTAAPLLTDMTLADLVGLTYTTAPLTDDVASAGPLALRVTLSTTAPGTGIWAVLSDVGPNGVGHPLTAGRLNTDFPNVVEAKSVKDAQGRIVQPFGDFAKASPAKPLAFRPYQVEFWPVGNVFEKGHRIRVTIVGASAASRPSLPGVNTIRVGGPDGAQLLVPALPGSDLAAALPN
jgi:predicted acyl esterase